ncbi:MAG: ABC transporter permease [Patescibacteria group bacterium]|nr:ABC transporter permease [Patescibacteria group bacterium]
MKFRHLLKLSTRVFRARPQRTAFTILGISIGIGAILFLVSLGYGLERLILEQITTEEALLTLDVTPPKAELVTLDKEVLDQISKIPQVEEISPLVTIPGQITLGKLTSDTLFQVCHPSYFRLGGMRTVGGDFFKKERVYQTILSSSLLRTFNLKPEQALGQEVKFTLFLPKKVEEVEEIEVIPRKESYTISGIVEEEVLSLVYLPLATLEDLNLQTFSEAKVKVSQPKYMEPVRNQIIGRGFLVSSLSETVEEANKIFSTLQIILAIFGLIALFVAAVGLANTMTVALLERTNEIGVIKALGGENKDIGRMFLLEATIIGFLGGIGGIVLGRAGAAIFQGTMNTLARGLGGIAVDIFYTPLWFVIFIILFATFVGFLSGLFPAKRAAKMSPLEALRYK